MNPPGIPTNFVEVSPGNWAHPSRLKNGPPIPPAESYIPNYAPHKTTKKRNPSRLVGGLLPPKSKPDPIPALDQKPTTRPRRKTGLAVRVTIIRCGKKLLDCDNLSASFKGLRDSISLSLGIDDADIRIRWEYGQVETRGRTGTIVRIERL